MSKSRRARAVKCSLAARSPGGDLARGCFVEPTVVRAKSYRDRVAQEEVFGPFVTVLTFKSDEEAMEIANGTDYGLGSGLWTSNLQRAHRVARDLHAGMVWINSYKRVNPGSPFGGVGQSGYGREMGFDAMREYTQVKSVWVNVDARDTSSLRTLTIMRDFIYTSHPQRVVFGAGSLQHLAREIDALGARRALVLSTPEQRGQAERVAEMLGSHAAGIFDRAVMHVPIETARDARELALRLDADCAVAIGGGSTTGLGKAIALDSGLPILAIPTTYAGSEMTPIYGLTEAGLKKTGKDPRVLPRTVIYDPELSRTLPVGLSVTSGINAIAHAAEGLYAQDSNPVMDLMAQEGIAALARALPSDSPEA